MNSLKIQSLSCQYKQQIVLHQLDLELKKMKFYVYWEQVVAEKRHY